MEKTHRWKVSPAEAREIQLELRKQWEGGDRFGGLRTVAGLDASFLLTGSQAFTVKGRWSRLRAANYAIGGIVSLSYPDFQVVERVYAVEKLTFPYVPGFLSFREIPVLLSALKKLKTKPDLVFCDGQGYAHPRRMGLASHMGIVAGLPSIGCAKSILIGTHAALPQSAGSWVPLVDEKAGGETIGAALRTRDTVNPIYVSQGHRVTLETALRLVLEATDGFRIPRPTRLADQWVGEIKRREFPGNSPDSGDSSEN